MSDDGYDDDFEEYEYDDDFEDEPPSPVGAKAAAAKPAEALPAGARGVPSSRLTDAQRYVLRQTMALSMAHMKRVKLSKVDFDNVFSAASQSEYELFARGQGPYARLRAATAQTQVLGRDACEVDCQTEEVESAAAGCQAPEDRAEGTDLPLPAASSNAEKLSRPAPPPFRRICLTQPGAALPEGAITQRLSSFLHWAGPAVIGALGAAGRAGPDVPRPAQPLSGPLSAGFTPLAYPELLAGRPVVALQYAPSAVPLLLVAYGSPHSSWERRLKDHSLAGRGLCAVWDASAPARPQTLLASEGLPACVAWLPSRSAHVVFAGLQEGGICAWDLREPGAAHGSEVVNGQAVTLRSPSYSTERSADMTTAGGPVVALAALADRAAGDRGGCQLLALTRWGGASLWRLHQYTGSEAAGQLDPGMRLGSALRLVQTVVSIPLGLSTRAAAAAGVGAGAGPLAGSLHALTPLVQPHGEFVVAADGGKVLRGRLAGQPPAPKQFQWDVRYARSAGPCAAPPMRPDADAGVSSGTTGAAVTALAASPFCPSVFLAGQADGSLFVYSTASSAPRLCLLAASGAAIVAVHWSPAAPCIFFALDAAGSLLVFDLQANAAEPVLRLSASELGGPAAACTLSVSHVQAGGGMPATFAVGYPDGSLQHHVFGPQLQPGSSPQRGLDVLLRVLGITV